MPEELADTDDEGDDGAGRKDDEDTAKVGHAKLVAVFCGLYKKGNKFL